MTPETTSSPLRPDFVPDEVQSTSSLVPPYRDEDEVDEVTRRTRNHLVPGRGQPKITTGRQGR